MQYFQEKEFFEFMGDFNYDCGELSRTDTYNELAISSSIQKINKEICYVIALQLSIIGYGKKNFGKIKYMGEEIVIENFFKEHGILYNHGRDEKLEESDLTPRRLIRFFRYAIKEYLERNENIYPYLFKKYCPDRELELRKIIFNGYEHIIHPSDEEIAISLIKTYLNLDKRNGTNITDRIKRVLMARGFNFEFLEKIKL